MGAGKRGSILLLILAEIAALSLWFVSAAILPEMTAERPLTPFREAALTSAVQAGFVAGALGSAILGLADRLDPRRLFALCAILAAAANALLVLLPIGSLAAVSMRFLSGLLLAGVYPVGMKLAVGWGLKDRGLLVGLLVGGVTLGSATPHLLSLLGGSDWRLTVTLASLAAAGGGLAVLFTGLGPHHGRAPRFRLGDVMLAWSDRRIRLAIAGYLGHMWELYAMWAWIGAAAAASYSLSLEPGEADRLAKWTAFIAIGAGGIACGLAGYFADKIGKRQIAMLAMAGSGTAAVATALSFGGPPWLTFLLVVWWGIAVIPDSAQFSALVADFAPPERAGSLMTLQTALGFGLTIGTVQATPWLAEQWGWPLVMVLMALGPAYGLWAMARLKGVVARPGS